MMEEPPDDSLRCPIGLELFTDPVIGADGHTYERKNITTWLQTHGTSPLTRQPMDRNSLRPNHLVRKLIDEFIAASKERQYRFRLNVDVRKCEECPWRVSTGKVIYKAEWIRERGPRITLLEMEGVRACREASFYAQLSCHPHIIRTFGLVYTDTNSVSLVQEFSSHGDLSYQLREQHFCPSTTVLLEIFLQIIDALLHLVQNGIVHGDVACRNVLAFRLHPTRPKDNLFKLTDFGLMKGSTLFSVVDITTATTFTVKPIRYCAPEVLKKRNAPSSYSEKSDVYSMGMLIWEAHSQGEVPFASIESDVEVKRTRRSGQSLDRPQTCSTELWSLINTCWEFDPDARPTFKELRHHIMEMMRCDSNRRTFLTTSNEDPICHLKDTRLNGSGECPESLLSHQHEKDGNLDSDASSSILAQQLYGLDYDTSSLNDIACMYCQAKFPVDRLDTHEELCRLYGVTRDFIDYMPLQSRSLRTASSAEENSEEEEENNLDAMLPINQPTTSNHHSASSHPEQSDQPTTNDDVRTQLYEMITEDLNKFVFTTIPEGVDYIQCRVTRAKGDIYWLHAEQPTKKNKLFVLAARKRRWNTTSNYTISADTIDLLNDGRGVGGLQAKSFFGTEFVVFGQELHNRNQKTHDNSHGELAAILYETNILGFKGPRKMTVLLPRTRKNEEQRTNSRNQSDGLLERWKRHDMSDLAKWYNKTPVWCAETRTYFLKFNADRVKKGSVKNFQLVHDDDPNYICLEFGRVSKDDFVCDYRYPLCAVQAFGIVLSSFDSKQARE